MGKHKADILQIITGKKHYLYGISFGFFVIVCLAFVNNYFSQRVLPNVLFAGQNYGGMRMTQLNKELVSRTVNFQNSEIKFSIDGNPVELSVSDLGISYDSDFVAQQIYNSGRGKKFLFADVLVSLFNKRHISSVYDVNYDKFLTAYNKNFAPLEVHPKNASVVFLAGKPVTGDPQDGNVIAKQVFYGDLKSRVDNLDNSQINVSLVKQKPQVENAGAQKAYERANELTKSQITFSFGQDTWTLSGQNLFDLLQFGNSGNLNNIASFDLGDGLIGIEDFWLGEANTKSLVVGIDDTRVNTYLAGLEKVINKPRRDATLKFENGKVSQFSSAQDGQVLNTLETKQLLLKNLSAEGGQASLKTAIKLPVSVTRAQIANEQINSMGITELVGSGVSYFAGSIPSRIFNIGLGSSLINGALVKPGEIFSFDNLVGPVSKAQGFQQAYVINAGRTVLDDGGGICQVSTTVFRAALNAGLPIVARTAHAYRVGYYEQRGFKAGFDATIFSPSVDFKFKNDTDHYILVQTVFDKANLRLEVDIYGTRDGRTVQISDPVVSNIIPAPPAKYQDEPTLPKGVVKQVDFAAAGATSVFTRKVYKGEQLIIDDIFKSVYRPWQAVFLVGTA